VSAGAVVLLAPQGVWVRSTRRPWRHQDTCAGGPAQASQPAATWRSPASFDRWRRSTRPPP